MARQGKREANAAEIKEQLYRAAAKIVGNVGLADASISKITECAGVAQGTFYNYFDSREAIFRELFVAFGRRMREHIRRRVEGIDEFFARERRAFEAFFEFMHEYPFFARLLHESEFYAPALHRVFFKRIIDGYVTVLARASARGEIRPLTPEETEVIGLVLMSAREYLALHYRSQVQAKKLPPGLTDTYMDIVHGSLEKRAVLPARTETPPARGDRTPRQRSRRAVP